MKKIKSLLRITSKKSRKKSSPAVEKGIIADKGIFGGFKQLKEEFTDEVIVPSLKNSNETEVYDVLSADTEDSNTTDMENQQITCNFEETSSCLSMKSSASFYRSLSTESVNSILTNSETKEEENMPPGIIITTSLLISGAILLYATSNCELGIIFLALGTVIFLASVFALTTNKGKEVLNTVNAKLNDLLGWEQSTSQTNKSLLI
ncbi:hypothetical protein [Wolbachia endosymbiont of Chironomus riparius]|uniref:hypothetical protein n=1 Tax=Wolbachia endosymbiont of Chironomus riparius TaxID=2883238 RepID=UPI0020A0A616|nr:hypothetical protein [Wolbachia endosymbiont of Chironomus riparius]